MKHKLTIQDSDGQTVTEVVSMDIDFLAKIACLAPNTYRLIWWEWSGFQALDGTFWSDWARRNAPCLVTP